MALLSSAVTAGTNATATQYNNLRADLVAHTHDGSDTARAKQNRAFTWFLSGGLATGNEVGAKYICPQAMTVTNIRHKTGSGTGTLRLQTGTTDIKNSISSSSSLANETSFAVTALSAGDIITLDITAVSSLVDLYVVLETTQP